MFKSIGFLLLLFTTYGCIIADEVVNNKSEYSGSLASKVKTAISDYIKKEYKDYQYYKYGFSKLVIHKPIELVKKDSLLKLKPKTLEQKNNLKKSIDSLTLLIDKKQISYWIEMDHFFNVKNKKSKQIELYEATFYLNDSFQVIKTKPLVFIELSNKEEVIFSDFFFESPIFYANTYLESQEMSHKFYEFFKTELENKKGITEKSNFIKHIIWVCDEVKTEKSFKLNEIFKKLTIISFSNNQQIKNYKPLGFSNVFEIKEDNVLKNYYFFHKFSHSKANSMVEDAVYVAFTPYYELTDVFQLEQPIEQYFNE